MKLPEKQFEEARIRLRFLAVLKIALGKAPVNKLLSRLTLVSLVPFENNSCGTIPDKLFEFKYKS